MKIAVFSDSHGHTGYMDQAIERIGPAAVLHLGDGARDAAKLRALYPWLAVYSVRGNCDFSCDEQETKLVEFSGKRIFMTHGHLYSVKRGFESAISAARDAKADVLLFGHTHRAFCNYSHGLHILNPGTVSGRGAPTFGVVEIENGEIICYYLNL